MRKKKAELRQTVLGALKKLSPAERMEKSARVQAHVVDTPEFRAARAVMVYHSDPTEVETHDLVLAAMREGKRVGLPRTREGARSMQVLEILDVKRDLEPSRFGGFKEPLSALPTIAPEQLDLIIVPGRAFDARGRRLGRGGGYYDRFFAQGGIRAKTMALAFDCQVVDDVPTLEHDRTVDLIVTESRVIRSAKEKEE